MDKMKNSGMSETMQTLTRKSACVMLSLLLLLSAVLPVKAAAETASAKVVRVGSFEDTFNYVNEKGARKGYGYELLETLSGYAGWQFEYVTCDWSDCFEKLKNGEIDIIGGISYTEDRTQEMLTCSVFRPYFSSHSASITSGSVPIRTPIFLPFSVLKSEAEMSARERSA